MEEYETKYGKFKIYKNDKVIIHSLKQNLVYEQELIEKLIPFILSSKIILDIGAHIGSHCITYSQINPTSEIYSFEPQSKIFELLNQNIQNNNIKNIKSFNNSVGDKIRSVELNRTILKDTIPINEKNIEYGTEELFNMGGMYIGKGGEKSNMINIDSLNLKGCDFIKIDVEGFEPLVLLGAIETIRKYKPCILFEKNSKIIDYDTFLSLGEDISKSIDFNRLNCFEILGLEGYLIYHFESLNYMAIHLSKCNLSYKF